MIYSSENKNIKLLTSCKGCACRIYSKTLDVCHEVLTEQNPGNSSQSSFTTRCSRLGFHTLGRATGKDCEQNFQPGFLSFKILT